MAIRLYKPTSPARRFMSVLSFEGLTKKAPEKALTTDLRSKAGRNNTGFHLIHGFISFPFDYGFCSYCTFEHRLFNR